MTKSKTRKKARLLSRRKAPQKTSFDTSNPVERMRYAYGSGTEPSADRGDILGKIRQAGF